MEQALIKVKECDAFGYEKKQFYRDAEFFLHVLKEQCSNQEQAGEKEILACMTEISDFAEMIWKHPEQSTAGSML